MLKKVTIAGVLLIALSLLAGCDTLNSLRMMQINSNVKPVVSTEHPVQLNARFIGEKPYVYADVNGETLLFLVDTGARFLILFDTPKVKSLNLPEGFSLAMSGWGEEQDSRAYQTDIASLDLGGVRYDGLKAAYIPVSTSPYFLRDDQAYFDGVIGHDMLRHFAWTFNKADNQISVRTGAYQPEHPVAPLSVDISFSKVRVEGELAFNQHDRASGQFILDTGSRHYIKITSNYTTNRGINIDSASITAADFGLNGKVEHQRVTLPELTLGELTLNNVKTNLIPSKDEDEDDFWVLGNALLNQFVTTIDYPNERLYLEPLGEFHVRYNLLGLELRKIRSGEFVITYVFPNFPASNVDLAVGDLVTSLSDTPASTLSMDDMLNIAATPGTTKVCIQRERKCVDIPVAHVKGYSML